MFAKRGVMTRCDMQVRVRQNMTTHRGGDCEWQVSVASVSKLQIKRRESWGAVGQGKWRDDPQRQLMIYRDKCESLRQERVRRYRRRGVSERDNPQRQLTIYRDKCELLRRESQDERVRGMTCEWGQCNAGEEASVREMTHRGNLQRQIQIAEARASRQESLRYVMQVRVMWCRRRGVSERDDPQRQFMIYSDQCELLRRECWDKRVCEWGRCNAGEEVSVREMTHRGNLQFTETSVKCWGERVKTRECEAWHASEGKPMHEKRCVVCQCVSFQGKLCILLESGVGIAETGRVLLRQRRGWGNSRQLNWAPKIWGKRARWLLSSLRAREREQGSDLEKEKQGLEAGVFSYSYIISYRSQYTAWGWYWAESIVLIQRGKEQWCVPPHSEQRL
jgi:hypothetical protein